MRPFAFAAGGQLTQCLPKNLALSKLLVAVVPQLNSQFRSLSIAWNAAAPALTLARVVAGQLAPALREIFCCLIL